MEGWLTPIQKIVLGLLIATAVGGVIYMAVTNWASDNDDVITNPDYVSQSITRTLEEVMV